ncbi:MAG: DUF1646 domain-containing protein [Crenarchaeota archaeon]|nr:DUF1646 domain-containing protein [Thermoproteota archaeon]
MFQVSTIVLVILLVLILALPATVRKIEENLEIFLFAMAIIAGLATGKIFDINVWIEALRDPVMIHGIPIGIVQVVLIFGVIAYYIKDRIEHFAEKIMNMKHSHVILGLLTLALGLSSSVISVIVAAVILAEIVRALKVDRRSKVLYSIYSCFALGIGAVLTPVGEPLSTILVSKLKEAHYYTGPGFLFEVFAPIVIPLVIMFSILAALSIRSKVARRTVQEAQGPVEEEKLRDVFTRAGKIYLFIMALVILGASYGILVKLYFSKLTPDEFYFLGIMSAVVDNATLVAALVSPALSLKDIIFFVTSTLISGGFLVPGNIPNIIVASRVKIRFVEWAKYGLAIGVPVLLAVYILLVVAHIL